MMRKLYRAGVALGAAALVCTPFAASAWSHGKPGLWAITNQIDLGQNAPQIPPDQLEKMKQMGIKLPFAEPVTNKICITPEQAAMDEPPKPQQRDNSCQMKDIKKDGKTFSAEMVCSGETQATGHFQATYPDDENYTGSMDMNGTSRHGGPIAMKSQFTGKWLGADCGSVAPFKTPS